jgi:(p)ppGpp synthase/HD superfamily hydrolase
MNKRQKHLALATEIANRAEDLHPWEVAVYACNRERKADFSAFLVGLLHDALEDKYMTEAELAQFPEDVQEAVYDISRDSAKETYDEYLERMKEASALARKVKLTDAELNLQRCQRSFGYESLEKRYRHVIEVLT